ncbi:MAG: MFS transporter [Trueperaceae bacterium]
MRPAADRASGPYHGWIMVGALSVTETISYGILAYAFTVFIAPMQAELGWSVAAITGAYSLGLLTAGIAAVPVGRWLDEHGARLPMSAGSLLAGLMLFAWSGVDSLWAFYLLWAGLGFAMAAVLYEPAFAVLAAWFRRDLGKSLTVLTFLAGFASVIFIPLAGFLVEGYGWRSALRVLAVIQLTTFPLHALLLRRRPADLGLAPDGAAATVVGDSRADHGVSSGEAFARPDFRRLAVAFSLSTFVITAIGVHLVPLLVAAGSTVTAAAGIGGAIGLMALPGRIVLTPLGDVWPRRFVATGIFALQAIGLLALFAAAGTTAAVSAAALWAFVFLYGAGFGAITPARAALLAEYYGGAHFGRISGRMALINALARAVAPVSTGLLVTASGGDYRLLLVLLSLAVALAAIAVGIARPPAIAAGRSARLRG